MKILPVVLLSMLSLATAFGQRPSRSDESNCRILLDSTAVTVQPTGSGSFTICKKIQIQTTQGALNNRVITYDYDPLTAHATFHRVTLYRANGDVENLDITKACDYVAPARAIYWGARQIMIQVGHLEKGDVIDYQIDKQGFTYALLADGDDESRFVPPMVGQFYDIVPFWVDEPTVKKVYRVSMPMEKELQFQFYQGSCSSSMRYENGRKIYTFTVENATPSKSEPNMVSLYDVAPKLMMSTTSRWQDKSLWFNKTNEDYGSFKPIPEAEKKVAEIIAGKKTDMEKISALTHWVADNIRYSGITMGKGEGYTLHNLQMDFTDRCGVCKDIAGTLISFLRIAGFKAYPAMTMAGSRIESIPADHFNHCVVVCKLADGTYMPIDPTWVPFCRELWSSAEQQQNYLPGVPEGSDLRITPLSPAENHYVRINANNKIDDKGTLTGTFTISAEGQSDSNIRGIFTHGRQSQWQSFLENVLSNVSPRAKLISVDYGKNPRDYEAAPIKITFKYEIPEYAIVGNKTILFKPMTMNGLYNQVRTYLRINTDLPTREFAFKDGCSRLVELNETIQIPNGFKLRNDVKKDAKDSEAASFRGSLTQTGNKIVVHQTLTLRKRVYEASDWAGFREAVNTHKSYGDFLVINK